MNRSKQKTERKKIEYFRFEHSDSKPQKIWIQDEHGLKKIEAAKQYFGEFARLNKVG